MRPPTSQRVIWSLQTYSRIAGAAAVFVGGVVLLGWTFAIPSLTGVIPDQLSMEANSALAAVIGGTAVLLTSGSKVGPIRRLIANLGALTLVVLGLLTICEYAFHLDLGIDRILVGPASGTVGIVPVGRMAPNAALTFPLIGLSLLIIDV